MRSKNHYILIYKVCDKELKIEISVTPTSANTACHMFATPKTLSNKTKIFVPIANIKFCFITVFVFLDIFFVGLLFYL